MCVDLGGVSGDFGCGMRRSDSFVLCSSLYQADWICFVGTYRQILRLDLVDLRCVFRDLAEVAHVGLEQI